MLSPARTGYSDIIAGFNADRVPAALKPAMERYSCKVAKSKADRVECNRPFRPADRIGPHEAVIGILEPDGGQTRVQIRAETGLGKNWSAPIFQEMLRRLRTSH